VQIEKRRAKMDCRGPISEDTYKREAREEDGVKIQKLRLSEPIMRQSRRLKQTTNISYGLNKSNAMIMWGHQTFFCKHPHSKYFTQC
jgi:hypothetical protein